MTHWTKRCVGYCGVLLSALMGCDGGRTDVEESEVGQLVQQGTADSLVVASEVSSVGGGALETRPVSVAELPTLAMREDVRIGSVDDPNVGFSQIRRVQVSERGDVYVLDGLSREIRVFSHQGERIRVLGGEGEGPGEFTSPNLIGLLGDTLWVTDPVRRRMTWFGPDGDVLFTLTTQGVPYDPGVRGVRLTLVPSRPQENGLVESERMMGVTPDREIRPYEYPVIRFNREGEIVDTVRWVTADANASVFEVGGRQGYAPVFGLQRPVEMEGVAGSVVVDWSVPEGSPAGLIDIVRVGPAGDTIYRRQLHYTPIPTPSSVLDSLITPRLEAASFLGATPAELERALREAVQVPAYRPPVRTVHAGADGTAWLQLNTEAVDVTEWTLLSGDGSPLGRVTLPPGIQIHHSALPTVWAVQVDELEVPWLLRLTVQ